MSISFALLVGATGLLILSHVLPSAPGPRKWLMVRLGHRGFYAAYSLVSLAVLALVVWAYRAAEGPWLYTPTYEARYLAIGLMPLAVFLLIGRLTTRPRGDLPHGIYRITTVPGSLALTLWALLHLFNVGEARTVVIFAGMAVIALIALVKNHRQSPPARRRVGIVPFAAVLTGRERLVWHEIGWWRLGLAIATYLVLLAGHPYVIGVDPLLGVVH